MQTPVLVSFIIYMLFMIGIGIYFYFRSNNLGDYVLGGRGLGPGVTALSAGASDMSGWLLLGLPGMMYSEGIVGSWIALGLIVGAYVNWHYVARPLRIFTHKLHDAITIPDYLSKRFNDDNHQLRVITAVVILLFYTLYTSSGLVGGAKLFQATFGMDYGVALLVGSFIIVSYTFLGGYNAVSWTDFIQGILMMLALIVTPIVVVYHIGGLGAGLELIKAADPSKLDILRGSSLIGVISLLSWGLGYFGQPHILVRFMSIRHESEMDKAKVIGMTWMILSVIGSLSVGFFGFAYVLSEGINLQDSEKVFISLSQLLFNPWIAGFLLAAILAAIMSTIDSQLLVSSSVLTKDIYHELLRPHASDKELVWVGRMTVVGIAVIAYLLSKDPDSSVLKLVSYAWAGFGAAFGPLMILSLYKRNMTKMGAMAGMISGALVVIIWKPLEGGIFELYELFPAFIISWLAIMIFDKIGQKVSDESENIFDEVQESLEKYTKKKRKSCG